MSSLVEALQGLQTDAEHRSEYNEWLQNFQRSPEAWAVCSDQLRQQTDVGVKIFCAQTLRNKAMHDLHQLPDNKLALKENLLSLLEVNAQIQPVCVQICVALANLAMQAPEWEQPLDEMVTKLGDTHLLPCLLEFLKILPEDFGTFGRTQRAARAATIVGANAPKVLNLLLEKAQYLNEHKGVFFEALLPWIPEVPVLDLVKSPMMDWVFSALTSDDTISPAADCLCAIIHEADEVHDSNIQECISILLPKLLALREASQHYDDSELHRNMTLVFSRAAEDWHMLIVEQEAFKPLLDAVVDCVAVPDAELDVIEYTFSFLDKFELAINTPRLEHKRSDFTEEFVQLQKAFTGCLEPKEFSSTQEEEDFKDFRYDIGDMLKICCYILGPDMALLNACEDLKAALSGPWQRIEAILFSVRLMARRVPVDNSVLPRIFELFPQLPNNPQVVHAALLILGRYSEWAAEHTEFIDFELKYIIQGVQSSELHVRRAAAHALYFFLTDCAPAMVSYAPQLVQFYNSLSGSIDLDSQTKISEGIGAVLNQLNVSDTTSALESIFAPVIQRLESTTSIEELGQLGDDINALSGFAQILRTNGEADDSSPITLVAKHCHASFMTFFKAHGASNARVCDGITRYYIKIIRNSAAAVVEFLPTLLETVTFITQQQLQPAIPELLGALAQTYNDRQESMAQFEVMDVLFKFFEEQTEILLKAIEAAAKPHQLSGDLLENTFHFWCDCVLYYGVRFIFSDKFERTVKAAVAMLELAEDKVLISVANFFEDVNALCPQPSPNINPLDQNILAKISSSVKLYGDKLVYYMFIGYQYNYEKDFLHRADGIMDFVARAGQPESFDWINNAFNSLPSGSVSDAETQEALQQIAAIMTTRRSIGVGSVIQSYARAYVERNVLPRN